MNIRDKNALLTGRGPSRRHLLQGAGAFALAAAFAGSGRPHALSAGYDPKNMPARNSAS